MPCFVKLKPARNGKITMSFADIRISCPSREFLTSQICLLMSRKFPNLRIVHCCFYIIGLLNPEGHFNVFFIFKLSACVGEDVFKSIRKYFWLKMIEQIEGKSTETKGDVYH